MNILYITRKYPPSVGGMQRMNYCLANELSKKESVDKVVWGHSQFLLLIFLLKAAFSILTKTLISRRKYDSIIVGDAALAPIAAILKKMLKAPAFCIAHGLDITFANKVYQGYVVPRMKQLDMIFCVSDSTLRECERSGISPDRLERVPNGVEIPSVVPDKKTSLAELYRMGINIPQGSKIILTVARLVRRKGLPEFIEKAFMPLLTILPDTVYLVVGDGKDRARIDDTVSRCGLKHRVHILGKVDEYKLNCIYSVADVFAMPNIRIPGDMEGFGIVALEASGYAVPVVAFAVDGITDAVKNGVNGILVKEADYDAFKNEILKLLISDEERAGYAKGAREFARNRSWEIIAQDYLSIMKRTAGS